MRILFITQPDKKQFAVDGVEGASLMETAVQNEVPGILAECGGACSCATCHVIIDDSWIDRVGYPNSMEEDMLDFAYETQDNSRLSCQIVLDGTMDGMIVHVPSRQA